MDTYTAQDVEDKITSTKKPYKRVTLVDGYGARTERVSIWSDFPGYHGIQDGAEVMGNLTTSPDGKFKNLKPTGGGSYAPRPSSTPRSSSYGAKAGQERKGEMIEHAQDRKELSMRLQGAMRDATLITLASLKDSPFPDDEDFKKVWEMWRDYLMGQYEEKKKDEDVPF